MAPQVRVRGRTGPRSVRVCRGVQQRQCASLWGAGQCDADATPSFLCSLSATEHAGPAAEVRSETPGEREWGSGAPGGEPGALPAAGGANQRRGREAVQG